MSKKEPPAPTHDDLPEDFEVKIILPARFIPSGSRVSKPTGAKKYNLRRRVRFVETDGTTKTVDGLFLLDGGEYINSVDEHTSLCLYLRAGDVEHHPLFSEGDD